MRRWAEGCQSIRRLMAEIQTLGYVGCYAGLARLLAPCREHGSPHAVRVSTGHRLRACSGDTLRHKLLPALLGQPRTLLTERQAQTVDALKEQCPGYTTMRRLVLSFRTILRVGKVVTLRRWMVRAHATNIDVSNASCANCGRTSVRWKALCASARATDPSKGTSIASKCCGGRCTATAASNFCARDSCPSRSRLVADGRDQLEWSRHPRAASATIEFITYFCSARARYHRRRREIVRTQRARALHQRCGRP
jgi:hypothetical protein